MTKVFYWYGAALILAAVQIALIAGKLVGDIDWSWWWVMSPMWAPVAAVAVCIVILIAVLGGASSRGENPFQ